MSHFNTVVAVSRKVVELEQRAVLGPGHHEDADIVGGDVVVVDLRLASAFLVTDAVGVVVNLVIRITSYNVCYTKLLRIIPVKG